MLDANAEVLARRSHFESAFARATDVHGFEALHTPLVESRSLFAHALGCVSAFKKVFVGLTNCCC